MKNIVELRESLAKNYEKIESGEISFNKAKSLAQQANSLISSCRAEMEYLKMRGETRVIEFLEVKSENL
jgi:hypothetical protein